MVCWWWAQKCRKLKTFPWGMKRVQKELKICKKYGASGIKMSTQGSNSELTHLRGTIVGQAGSPYEGGAFEIDIRLPYDYPFEPPQVKFITKIWHPSVNIQTGETCPANAPDGWAPAVTLVTLLLYLQALLSKPEPEFFLDTVVTQQYLNDYPTFVAKAQNWTEAFAKKESSWIKLKGY